MSDWDADAIQRMQSNPVYVGIGPFARIISDELWVASFKKLIDDVGIDAALHMMLDELRKTDWALPKATP